MSQALDKIAAALVAANEALYDAFDTGDMDAMAEVWAAELPVACIHPGGGAITGREEVLQSWREILSASGRPAIQCLEPQPMVFNDSGLVICTEALAGGRLMASNLFALENGVWRMVHHQAGPMNTPMPRSNSGPSLH